MKILIKRIKCLPRLPPDNRHSNQCHQSYSKKLNHLLLIRVFIMNSLLRDLYAHSLLPMKSGPEILPYIFRLCNSIRTLRCNNCTAMNIFCTDFTGSNYIYCGSHFLILCNLNSCLYTRKEELENSIFFEPRGLFRSIMGSNLKSR